MRGSGAIVFAGLLLAIVFLSPAFSQPDSSVFEEPDSSMNQPYGNPSYGLYGPFPYPFPSYYPLESDSQTYIYLTPEGSAAETLQQNDPAQEYSWYYCKSPDGYYPYVTACPGGWSEVPPAPSR